MTSIASKISKIIAKADSTTSSQEADAFMAKAHQMMEEHGLSLLDLGRLDEDDPVGRTDDAYVSSEPWKNTVGNQLALYYGCKIVLSQASTRSKTFIAFGRESARVTFQLMMPYIVKQIGKIASEEVKLGHYKSRHLACTAVANALAARLYDLRLANEIRQEGSGLNALVPVDMIQAAMEEAFPRLRMTRSKTGYDRNAARRAQGISLNQQTRADPAAKRLA